MISNSRRCLFRARIMRRFFELGAKRGRQGNRARYSKAPRRGVIGGNKLFRSSPASSRHADLLLMQLTATHQAPGNVSRLQRRAFGR